MKIFYILFYLSVLSIQPALAVKYKVTCENEDCFRYGWSMVSMMASGIPSYHLKAVCKKRDCSKQGWTSSDTLGSKYNVTCRRGGCFNNGWFSIEKIKSKVKFDLALCKGRGCLIDGWNVTNSYGGGDVVSCIHDDCSRFGGVAHFRKRTSKTTCIKQDCYRTGWILEIY